MKTILFNTLLLISLVGYSQTDTIQRDTTFAYYTETIVDVDFLEVVKVQSDERFYINSRSNDVVKGGKSRIILPVNLPFNTIEWYYEFSASRNENDVISTMNSFALLKELTSYAEDKNSMLNAVSNLTPPPGANICDVYLVDKLNAELFRDKKEFQFDMNGSRENYKSGVVTISEVTNKQVYLAIKNPDNVYGIHVAFQIVAIVKNQKQETKAYKIPVITSYLK